MTEASEYIVSCDANSRVTDRKQKYLELAFRAQQNRNVDLCFDDSFRLHDLDDRIIDLVELTAYLYSAEIKSTLEEPVDDNVRHKIFNFYVGVRDFNYWKQPGSKILLNELLNFLTGNTYNFIFSKINQPENNNHKNRKIFKEKRLVTFHSGGIDPTAGVIALLENNPGDKICMVSHQSGLPGTAYTQNNLYSLISELYPDRCSHIKYRCGLYNNHSSGKNNPTRALLYNAVAFAAAIRYSQDHYYMFENGISSINFRGINSFDNSTGRSVHPKTLRLMEELFTRVSGTQFTIEQPFLFKRKSEVIRVLSDYGRHDLLRQTTSCDRNYSIPIAFSHCGICPSCITRRIALFAAGCPKEHQGKFYYDFLTETNLAPPLKETIETMLREMIFFINQNSSAFCRIWEDELISVEANTRNHNSYPSVTEKIYDLCRRHFQDMKEAVSLMWNEYYAPWSLNNGGSFFNLLTESRTYMAELQSRELCESEVEYRSTSSAERSEILRLIPPRGLKMKIIEKCFELIERNEITDKLSYKIVSEILIKELKQEFILSPGNERSIIDYFRKDELKIVKVDGKLTVINNKIPVKY